MALSSVARLASGDSPPGTTPAHAIGSAAASAATGAPISPENAAEAKRRFTEGLKLYGEHAYVEALAEFEMSYRLGRRPSALRNIAQCHRDLRHFAAAYEAYADLLATHGALLSKKDKEAVTHALDELAELSGTVTVASSEAGATVALDGKPLGTTPLATSRRVSLGAHHVVITKPGFEPFEKTVTVESAASVTIEAALSAEVTTGHLTVREQTGDAVNVIIDGKDVGPAPWEGDLPAGEHTLEARGPRFAADERPFALTQKQRLDIVIDATSTLGHARITTLPASAQIFVDGQDVGNGVWDADIPPGVHHVEVGVPGRSRTVRELSVQRGQVLVAEIPVPVEDPSARPPDYAGVYAKLSVFGAASPGATDLFANDGAPNFHFGGGAALRIGYSFGIWGLELVAAGMFDAYTDAVNTAGSPSFTYQSTSADGFAGIGGRITSHGATARGTLSVAPGVAFHNINVHAETSASNNCSSSSSLNPCTSGSSGNSSMQAGYVAPGLIFDGGLLVGNTPGAKFFLGIEGWLDLAPTLYVGPDTNIGPASSAYYAGRALKVVDGPQFYLGPALGVQFGH
jgi:hypothetical protein